MKKYAIKRILQLIPILFAITFLSYGMMRIAGSDVVTRKMENTGGVVSEAELDAAREELGLDKPFLTQYFVWLGKLLRGDMGNSYVSGVSVFDTFISKLPATLLLTATSILLTIIISIPLGILSAVKQNTIADYLIRFCSFIGNSLPNFFVSLLLMYFLAIQARIFPVIAKDVSLKSVAMPAITLAIAMSAKYLRQVRATVLDELSKDYVTGARARGVKFSVTLWKSIMKASLVTVITLLMLSVGNLLGGTAIVESIFMWDDQFKPYGATPGHGIEWARLITQWALSTYKEDKAGAAPYIEAAENLYNRAVADAWNADGAPGICYTTDWNGKPVVHDRMHWTLAEAINTSSVLFHVTDNEKYAADYAEFMKYLDEKVLDHVNGSWFHQLDRENNLLETVWPGKSDIYHALQATLIPYYAPGLSIAVAVKKQAR